jgi:hypothetical protein
MPFQEGPLGLGGERDVERPAGVRQPHHEHPQLEQRPGHGGIGLAEVDLGLRVRRMRLRHRDLDPVQAELDPAARDIPGHRHLRQRGIVLGDQPLPDPPRRVPLLARHLPIRQQPSVDHLHVGVDRRPRPRGIRLACRRDRAGQRLTHRAAMHVMPVGQLSDRQLLDPPVSSDLLEQLHPRPCHSLTSTTATLT